MNKIYDMYVVTKGESLEDAIANHDKPYHYEYEAIEDMKDLSMEDPADGIIVRLVHCFTGTTQIAKTDFYHVSVDKDSGLIRAIPTQYKMTQNEMEERVLSLITSIWRSSKKNLPYEEDAKELKILLMQTPKLRAALTSITYF